MRKTCERRRKMAHNPTLMSYFIHIWNTAALPIQKNATICLSVIKSPKTGMLIVIKPLICKSVCWICWWRFWETLKYTKILWIAERQFGHSWRALEMIREPQKNNVTEKASAEVAGLFHLISCHLKISILHNTIFFSGSLTNDGQYFFPSYLASPSLPQLELHNIQERKTSSKSSALPILIV